MKQKENKLLQNSQTHIASSLFVKAHFQVVWDKTNTKEFYKNK